MFKRTIPISLEETQEAVKVINAEFPGIGAYLIKVGEHLEIGLSKYDAREIAQMMAEDAEVTASFLPTGTYIEALNNTRLRLVRKTQ